MKHRSLIQRTVDLTIRDVAFGGDGVGCTDDGMAVFVPFVIEGERVLVRVERQRKKSAEASLLKVIQPSPVRVNAPCRYFERCGGCCYQHVEYNAQLAMKSRQVEQTLCRIGKLETVPMRDIVRSPNQYGYRNRIRVHAKGGRVGFFAYRSNDLVEIDRCAIAAEAVNRRLSKLRAKSLVDGDYTLAVLDEVRYFSQINDRVAQEMVGVVMSHFRKPSCVLVDAYCGAGFFSRRLLDCAERVIGIERNEAAVEYARKSATEKETYILAEVEEILGEVLAREDSRSLVLLLDPPATGVAPRVSDAILSSLPETIIYVSCNPATLARDLLLLLNEYVVESVTPVDMFPQTAEIEVVTCLRNKAEV